MKTAIYLRQSLDRDQTKLAVDRQRAACLALCEQKGWTDTVEYVDNDTSASTGRREHYNQMLADIEAGGIGAVICYHLDRLHRQPRELEDFITLADRQRVKLATVTGETDLGTDQGRLIARIMGAVAKAEVERKSARQKLANRQRAEAGHIWQRRPFGYNGTEVVPEEAEAIREGCAALLAGTSLFEIARQWTRKGYLTSRGGTVWTGSSVRQILSNPRHAGLQQYDGQILEGVEVSWPAIVERDVWESVCALLANPKRSTGRSRARKYLLTGIAICGVCGHTIGSGSRTDRKPGSRMAYVCKQPECMRIVRSLVATDQVVKVWVTELLSRPDAAVIFAKPTGDQSALNTEITMIGQRIAETHDEYNDGLINARDRNVRLQRLEEKKQAIQSRMLEANTSRVLDGLLGPNAPLRFEDLTLDRQRAVVNTVCQVTINRQKQGGRFDPKSVVVEFRQPSTV